MHTTISRSAVKAMQALLEYVQTTGSPIPPTDRPNVAKSAVRSITLGMVNQRPAYGIANATTHDNFALLKTVLALLEDPGISGDAPSQFTSVCVNVDFGCALHTDRFNDGPSTMCALGPFVGGELFVEKTPDQEGEQPHTTEIDGVAHEGVRVDVRDSWYTFDGAALPHMTLPYTGFRLSVVFFSVPVGRCDTRDLCRLASLGFRVTLPRAPWPYDVFCCSTRRPQTIAKDTLAALLADGSIPAAAVTLCVSDETDAESYRPLGLRLLVAPGGLPQQRAVCTRALPDGSWALHVDDDITEVVKPPDLSLHELIMLGFLLAARSRTRLWGLNTSADARNLRPYVSQAPGLVNGYWFGGIVADATRDCTPLSDRVGGAAEDVERSIRHFANAGITRLCFATAMARNQTNKGGLQSYYGTRHARAAARDYVVQALCDEFPALLRAEPDAPNGCHFLRPPRATSAEAESSSEAAGEKIDGPASEAGDDADDSGLPGGTDDEGEPEPEQQRPPRDRSHVAPCAAACSVCGKVYRRKTDLDHHMAQTHGTKPAEKSACPACGKTFRKRKDMLLHWRLGRCESKRGRKWTEWSSSERGLGEQKQGPSTEGAVAD